MTLDTGSVCNLRCVHCFRQNPSHGFIERSTDPDLPARLGEHWPYLDQLSLHGLGEPLLSDLFWEIVEDERTKGIPQLDINTNGTLLTEKNVDRLLASNLKHLRISLDGATSPTYQKIRGVKLDRVTAGIRRLTERRSELGREDFRVSLQMTLMMVNIRELPAMIDLAWELGVDEVWAHHLLMRSDGSHDEWRITRTGWRFAYTEQHMSNAPALNNAMVRRAKTRADRLGVTFEVHPELELPEPGAAKSDFKRRQIGECRVPWEWLLIDPLGGAYPCCFAVRSVGNLKEQTFEEIWNGSEMIRLRASIRDGYIDRVCRHAACRIVQDTLEDRGVDAYDLRCEMNAEVSVRSGKGTDHCVSGWSYPEELGIWSEGEEATFVLHLVEDPCSDAELSMLCRGVGHERYPPSGVRVEVNGRELGRWEFRYPDAIEQSVWRTIRVPADLMTTPRLEVHFHVEEPLSPQLWGSDDGRLLGIFVSAFRVRPAVGSEPAETPVARVGPALDGGPINSLGRSLAALGRSLKYEGVRATGRKLAKRIVQSLDTLRFPSER